MFGRKQMEQAPLPPMRVYVSEETNVNGCRSLEFHFRASGSKWDLGKTNLYGYKAEGPFANLRAGDILEVNLNPIGRGNCA